MPQKELFAYQSCADNSTNAWVNGANAALNGWVLSATGLSWATAFKFQGTFTGTNSDDLYCTLDFNEATQGISTYEFYIKTHTSANRGIAFGIANNTRSLLTASRVCYFNIDNNGSDLRLHRHDGTGFVSGTTNLAQDTVFLIKITVNRTTNQYTISINGTNEFTNIALLNNLDPNRITFNRSSTESPTGSAWFSEVRAYTDHVTTNTNGIQAHRVGANPDHTNSEDVTAKPNRQIFRRGAEIWLISYDGRTGWYLYKYDATFSGFQSRGIRIQTDPDSRISCDYDGTNLWLVKSDETQNVLYKCTYNATDAAFDITSSGNVGGAFTPTSINSLHCTLASDTSSRLWLFWFTGGTISCEARLKSDLTLVASSNQSLVTGLNTDDLMQTIQFNDGVASIGIIHSDQTGTMKMRFLHRHDSDGVTTWQTVEDIQTVTNESDDHADICAQSNGTLHAVWKTSLTANGANNIQYKKRNTSGTWETLTNVWTRYGASANEEYTRPRIFLDETNSNIYIAATRDTGGGDIYYKSSPVGTISFSAETKVLDATTLLNNVAGAYGTFTGTSDLAFMAHGADDNLYYSILDLAGSASIDPTGIASAEAFGTPSLNQNISPSGISSAEEFGSLSIAFVIGTTGIPSGEAFGSPQLTQIISVSSISSEEAFGAPSLGLNILPTGITSSETFGNLSLSRDISPTGITSGEAFGAPQVNLNISPSGISSSEAFGTPTVNLQGSLQINCIGIPTSEAFGSPQVNQNIVPTSIASLEAFGTPTVSLQGALQIICTGIPTAEAFGSPSLIQNILPASITSLEAFGTAQINSDIVLIGIASAEAFGNPSLLQNIAVSGINSSEAFGNPTFNLSVSILAISITSDEAFGNAVLNQIITMSGIPSEEVFGTLVIIGGATAVGWIEASINMYPAIDASILVRN